EGEFVEYDHDCVAIDIGLHLTAPEGPARRATHTRIWFQLKGLHDETLPMRDFQSKSYVTIPLQLEHLRFWFASPEPIYLAVYVEAAEKFLVEDVREIVYRQWSEEFLTPAAFPNDQRTV